MEFLKKWDIYGKPVTFYYNTSTVHKTYFGALLSILSFSLMTTITITSLINFLYQKPAISSNLVYFINKKFAQLDAMVIKGKLTTGELDIQNQLDTFVKYYRIVLHEKYFDGVETFHVAKLVKTEETLYEFNVTMSIKEVFKEKEFSTLKIMSCADIKKQKKVDWASSYNETTCNLNYENYFKKEFFSNSFLLSFDAPNYSVDRKGALIKVPHQNELNFKVVQGKKFSYLMETKYVVIQDDTNIYYTSKKYDAYFTMKRPIEMKEDLYNNKFMVEILLQNNNNDQIVLISLYKYKLLDFLAKLGGIMKIITFMKMTGKFWSSYFYEKTLYNLLMKRNNPYLSQKIKLLELLKNKKMDLNNGLAMINNMPTPNGGENPENSNNFILVKKNVKFDKKEVINNNESYSSYKAWFMNRFCKFIFVDKEAKEKREKLAETLGLNNYLMHLDYVDRLILLEQYEGDINKKIDDIINNNKRKESENSGYKNEAMKFDFQKTDKNMELSLIEQIRENNLKKPLNT